MKRAFGRSWSRRLVVGLSRSSVGEEFGEVEVHAVGLDEADPVDCAGWIAKGVDELAGQLVLQRGTTLDEAVIVFFGTIANWFNDVGIEVGVIANQIPKILADDLEIAIR